MKIIDNFYTYLSKITLIDKIYFELVFSTLLVIIVFIGLRKIGSYFISRKMDGRREFLLTQTYFIILNVIEVFFFIFIWDDYIKSLMTLISVISAAVTIALREIIMNFFCGIYIKMKRPFKVEDRIQIDDIKGDVMNISALDFEILEISNKDENGQSTGVIVTMPNSFVFTKSIKNITKGFKYVWNEITVKVPLKCDLVKNKQEIYNQINSLNNNTRIYFNQYDPVIYTKIVDNHIELTIRYLMHPKKARYIESVLWNKIYQSYMDKKIDLYIETE